MIRDLKVVSIKALPPRTFGEDRHVVKAVGRRETAGDEKVPPPSADVIYVEVTGQQARQLLGRTLRVQIDVDDDEAGAS